MSEGEEGGHGYLLFSLDTSSHFTPGSVGVDDGITQERLGRLRLYRVCPVFN